MGLKTKVTEIVDGDTFKVDPTWKWGDKTGDTVRPTGFNTPEKGEEGYEEATKKLSDLILRKEVTLENPKTVDRGRLVCDVFVDGKNLADYFPEYAV